MNDDVKELSLAMEQARDAIQLGQSLDRLFDNQDFQKVITNGYFKEEAQRLVELKAAPQCQSEELQQRIIKEIDGIGALQQYFNMIRAFADQSKIALQDAQEEIEVIESAEAVH